jgi:hypothetical protein
MSKADRTYSEPGIRPRHSRGRRHRDGRCTCMPTFRAEVFDAGIRKEIAKSFPTITAVRRWRQDAYAALRSGTLSANRGPTLREAADDWLMAARAGVVRNRSGEPYKPSAIRGYEQNLRKRVLPVLGTSGCARSRCRIYSASWTGSPPTGWLPPRSPRRSPRYARSTAAPAS